MTDQDSPATPSVETRTADSYTVANRISGFVHEPDSPATGEGLREALTDLRADVLALGRSEHGFISRYRVLELFDNELARLAATTLDPGEAE